jgi:plastocyanin
MKKFVKNALLIIAILIGGTSMAQDHMKKEMKSETKVIQLKQTPGEFDKTELTLVAGQAYVFEVSNDGVDHAVGFVVAPEGKTEQENHIKEAYVQEMVENGNSSTSKEVVLEKGEYVFFCPMNPTPEYKIIVQ